MTRFLSTPLLATAALTLSLFGCGGLNGNGHVTTEARTVGAFNQIEVGSGIRSQISEGPASVSVIADENLVASIETVVRGDTLVIRLKEPVARAKALQVDVSNTLFNRVSASGGAHIRGACTGASAPQLEASGGSTIELNSLEVDHLSLDASGGSEVTLAGKANAFELNVSGGSQVTAKDLDVATAVVDGSGGSTISIAASASVGGNASGGTVITISGAATAQVSTSGGSVVSREN
jgi:hypothetical protein